MADFSLVDSAAKPVTRAHLLGKVCIADFIFTRCSGPCPRTTAAMAQLQREIRSSEVRFVSFSVDPAFDTPPVLAAYARAYGADPERWTFLTGSLDQIRSLSVDSFRLAFSSAPPGQADPGSQVSHSTRFVLLDRSCQIRGYYDPEDPGSLEALRAAVALLLRAEPS